MHRKVSLLCVIALFASVAVAITPSYHANTPRSLMASHLETRATAKSSFTLKDLPALVKKGSTFLDLVALYAAPGSIKKTDKEAGDNVPLQVHWYADSMTANPAKPVTYPSGIVLYHGNSADLCGTTKVVKFLEMPTWFGVQMQTSVALAVSKAALSGKDFYVYEFHTSKNVELLANPPTPELYNKRLNELMYFKNGKELKFMSKTSPMEPMAVSKFCKGWDEDVMKKTNAVVKKHKIPLAPMEAKKDLKDSIALPQKPTSYDGWRSPWDQNEVMLCPTTVSTSLVGVNRFQCTIKQICDAIFIKNGNNEEKMDYNACKSAFKPYYLNKRGDYDYDGFDIDFSPVVDKGVDKTVKTEKYTFASKTPTVKNVVLDADVPDLEKIVRKVCTKTELSETKVEFLT